jgi:hypothetical protein
LGARISSLALAGALLVAAPAVHAEESGYRLQLVRAEGTGSCPTASALEQDVTQRLGRNPFSASAEHGIEIVLERDASKWRARLYLRIADGQEDSARVLESDAADCAELGRAVTLAVALALAPELPPSSPPAPSATTPEPPPSPVEVDPELVEPPEAPRPPSSLHGAASLRALGSPNLLPRAAFGGALSVTVRGDLLGLHVGALFYPQQELERAGARLAFGLSAAQLAGCLWARRSDPELWSCLGAQVGALHAVVYSPQPTSPGDRVWAAASSELGLRQSLGERLFVEAGATGIFPFVRNRFAIGGEPGGTGSVVFEQRGAIVEGFAGLGFRLD